MSMSNTPSEPGQHWTPGSEDDVEGHGVQDDRAAEAARSARAEENTEDTDDVEGHRNVASSDDSMTRKAHDDEDGAPGLRGY